jgi:large subunit ribosomal protein L29
MDIQKARELEAAEITKQVKDAEDTMFRLKFQMTMGQNDGIKKYRELRKDKARMLTVASERAIESRRAPAPVVQARVAKAPVAKAPVAKARVAKAKEGKK